MRMLGDLRDHLDEIEKANDWEYRFITDLLERKELRPDCRLSGKQFSLLTDIHHKYCRR